MEDAAEDVTTVVAETVTVEVEIAMIVDLVENAEAENVVIAANVAIGKATNSHDFSSTWEKRAE
jgi:hypothetical protein